jgi:catechol 2,3-dioxygenase-like lactoylglutathione lyase family enzyme
VRPRLKVVTLGVDDLERALAFYRNGLGLATKGIVGTEFEDGAVVFFDLNDGLVLALWPRRSLAKDANLPVGPRSPAEFSLGHNVGSREEVDEIVAAAERAGGHVLDPPHDTFWGGYAGYFQDPDGHLWEIAWNPAWEVRE